MATKMHNVTMEDVTIMYPNFSGRPDKFNSQGKRQFLVVLPPDVANQMQSDGWNVKLKEANEELGYPERWTLQVNIRFDVMPPKIVMITSRGRTYLGEGEVDLLDFAEIVHVDLIVRPYEWGPIGDKSGITAYLHSLYVTIHEDELELKYADTPIQGHAPQEN